MPSLKAGTRGGQPFHASNGCDAPKNYGPPKALYNRWKRWSDKGVFARMMEGLAAEAAVPKTAMIDATYLKAIRMATRGAV
jgi:transposase